MSEVEKVQRDEKTKRRGRRAPKEGERKKLPWWGVGLILVLAAASSFGAIFALVEIMSYVPPDEDPPVIALNGEEVVELPLGSEAPYEDAGAAAWDERDGELEVVAEVPEMDIWKAGEYEVKYKASDAAENTAEASRTVKIVAPAPVEGAVYLTFDDGPSEHTARLLDVLKKYGVKVTFFVIVSILNCLNIPVIVLLTCLSFHLYFYRQF